MSVSLTEYASIAVKHAISSGASEAEAYVTRSKDNEVEIQNNTIKQAYASIDSGLGIRVVVGNNIGFSYTNKLDRKSIEEAVERAIKIARASEPDPYWKGLPEPSTTYPRPEGTFSLELSRIKLENIVEKAGILLDKLLEDKRITVVWGTLTTSTWSIAVANSNGVYQVDHGTVAVVAAEVVARENGDVTPGIFEVDLSRTTFPNVEGLAEKLREKAIKNLHPVKIDEIKLPVIMTNYAIESIFTYTFNQAIRGDNVVRGRSPYKDKLGEKVAVEELTIIDDGTLRNGLYTSIFDAEGIARRRTVIIEKGVLRNFIYDNYWAKRANTESTGNASRRDYASTPVISPSNLVIEPGTFSEEEIVSDTRKGLLVDGLQGAHSSNPETGEFSVVATPAWYIDNGELKPVRGIMLAGNIYELLNKITGMTKTTKQVGTLKAPWIRFANVRVVVKK